MSMSELEKIRDDASVLLPDKHGHFLDLSDLEVL